MSEYILVAVAWPYANGSLHLGHIAGAYLPADIFARYNRLKGNHVLMVSGSDQHGTPITLRAEQELKSPQEIASRYHQEFLQCWQELGISFDLFTTTGTDNHAQVTQDMFLELLQNGYIYKDKMLQAFCPTCQRFLADRYIEGTCPYCGYSNARGDQCDGCGKPINPSELKDIRCKICSSTPRFESSEHFFLRLSALQKQLEDWVTKQKHWRNTVLSSTWKYLNEGLKDRAITRDIKWGIKIPLDGFEGKRIYVWFEAVTGYLSASKEWAKLHGNENEWQKYWHNDAKSFYFIGKDNTFFHTLVWPAMLIGYKNLNLPYDVPANEFLTIEGSKLSTSRNWAVWLPDYLQRYDADPLRYYLTSSMPENADSDFSWEKFLRSNNNELVATYGNLIHRALTFTYRNYNGTVPSPGELDEPSKKLLQLAEITLNDVNGALGRCSFREALRLNMSLAQEANRYLDAQAPWKTIKSDKEVAARTMYTVLCIAAVLRVTMYPFLPFSSEKLHAFLGFSGSIKDVGWRLQFPAIGQKLEEPHALFKKLDDSIVADETAQIGQVTGL